LKSRLLYGYLTTPHSGAVLHPAKILLLVKVAGQKMYRNLNVLLKRNKTANVNNKQKATPIGYLA
jgi:hypothetical protein